MPYVPSSDQVNLPFVLIPDIVQDHGAGNWRHPIVGSDRCRAVLLHLRPGEAPHPIHRHPRADEVFVILEGTATFMIGDGPAFAAGPGTVACAPAGVRHNIAAGNEPLLFLAIVAPNLNSADEAIEDE